MKLEERLLEVSDLFQKYKSPISVATRMAQFVLESEAGESELYKKSYNGFGIKASAPWTGDKVLHKSMEADGKLHASYFRKYPSLEASIADHANFFTSTAYRQNTAYKASIKADNYRNEAEGLTGIYAGDQEYGRKLIKIIEQYNLTQYDVEATEDDVVNDWHPQIIDRRDVAIGGQRRDRELDEITVIVWHYTAVPRSYRRTIANHESYWRNTHGWTRGGYHYYIDADGVLYQNYQLEMMTWGVANQNQHTVHISVEANSNDNYSVEQIKTRDWITRKLMKDLGIPAEKVKGHWEVNNNTNCPGYSKAEMDAYRRDLAIPVKQIEEDEVSILENSYLIFLGQKYSLVPTE